MFGNLTALSEFPTILTFLVVTFTKVPSEEIPRPLKLTIWHLVTVLQDSPFLATVLVTIVAWGIVSRKRIVFVGHPFRYVLWGLIDGELFRIEDSLLSMILVPSVQSCLCSLRP